MKKNVSHLHLLLKVFLQMQQMLDRVLYALGDAALFVFSTSFLIEQSVEKHSFIPPIKTKISIYYIQKEMASKLLLLSFFLPLPASRVHLVHPDLGVHLVHPEHGVRTSCTP